MVFVSVDAILHSGAYFGELQFTSSAGNTCVEADVNGPSSATFSWRIDPNKLGAPHALIWAGHGYDDSSGIC